VFVTLADVPAEPVVVFPIEIVADPLVPVGPVAPVAPFAPAAPVGPVAPVGPIAPPSTGCGPMTTSNVAVPEAPLQPVMTSVYAPSATRGKAALTTVALAADTVSAVPPSVTVGFVAHDDVDVTQNPDPSILSSVGVPELEYTV
jgi:hypothetical protein